MNFQVSRVEKDNHAQRVQNNMKNFAYKQGLLVKFAHFQDVFMHKGH